MESDLSVRLARVEASVARLATAVDGVVEAVVAAIEDARPLVVSRQQLREAVAEAMQKRTDKEASVIEKAPPVAKPAVTVDAAGKQRRQQVTANRPTARPVVEQQPAVVQRIEPDAPSPPPITLAMLDPSLFLPTANKSVAPPRAVPAPPSRPPPPAAPLQVALSRPLQRTMPVAVTPTVTPPRASTSTANRKLYLWGNAWHHLPEDYEFPKTSLEIMWRQWCCGDDENGILPLRDVVTNDIASNYSRKRFSDLKFLMKHIEQQLHDRGVWRDSPNTVEADQMLLAVRETFPFASSVSKNGQKRGLEELKWHSAVTLLRGANKKARNE